MNFKLFVITLLVCFASSALSNSFVYSQDGFKALGASVIRVEASARTYLNSNLQNSTAASHFINAESVFKYNVIESADAGYDIGQTDSLIDEQGELIDLVKNQDLSASWLNVTWQGDNPGLDLYNSISFNEKRDLIGGVYEWAHIGATADFNYWLVPELRVGNRKQFGGLKHGYYSLGLTLFKNADLDIKWRKETVKVDDSNVPPSAFFSFAIQTKF